MKREGVRTFKSRLREDLKDPEFKRHYDEEKQALKLAMKIAALREQKGLSQQQLAKLMGTSQQAISRIESGEYEGFTLKTLEKVAEATGMKIKIDFVAA
jgi:DNA-binding XRE family transcriptional regulator